MWPVINSSALIGGFFLKKPLQDLLSSVNAVISTNERIEFITFHMNYNPAYTLNHQDRNSYSSNVPTNPITITRIFPHWPMEQI